MTPAQGLHAQIEKWSKNLIVRSHIGWEENKTFFIKVWKPLPYRRVLKTLRETPKGKGQRE